MYIAYYLPEKVIDNEQLCADFGVWTPNKIRKMIGIESRHIAGDNETGLDLAVNAAERLFEGRPELRARIDYVVYCTQSPDYILPTTACLFQHRVNLKTSCAALDINLGCSGYVYGLSLAKALLVSEMASCVALVTSETYSKYINSKDKSTRTIFGDAAAITVLERDDVEKMDCFVFGTDGSGYDNLIVPASATRVKRCESTAIEKLDDSGNIRSAENLYMNGTEIFNFTLEAVPKLVTKILGMAKQDVDYYIFHQANRYMLENLRDKIGISENKFYVDMEKTGNTVSSTIPIAISDCLKKGLIKKGDRVVLAGFGVGYSWAGCVIII